MFVVVSGFDDVRWFGGDSDFFLNDFLNRWNSKVITECIVGYIPRNICYQSEYF